LEIGEIVVKNEFCLCFLFKETKIGFIGFRFVVVVVVVDELVDEQPIRISFFQLLFE
jgi:hypothetical protein